MAFADTKALKIQQGLFALLFAIAIAFEITVDSKYLYFYYPVSQNWYILLATLYGSAHLWGAYTRTPLWVKLGASGIGIWLWSVLIATKFIFQPFHTPSDFALFVFVSSEVMILVQAIQDKNVSWEKRKNGRNRRTYKSTPLS